MREFEDHLAQQEQDLNQRAVDLQKQRDELQRQQEQLNAQKIELQQVRSSTVLLEKGYSLREMTEAWIQMARISYGTITRNESCHLEDGS